MQLREPEPPEEHTCQLPWKTVSKIFAHFVMRNEALYSILSTNTYRTVVGAHYVQAKQKRLCHLKGTSWLKLSFSKLPIRHIALAFFFPLTTPLNISGSFPHYILFICSAFHTFMLPFSAELTLLDFFVFLFQNFKLHLSRKWKYLATDRKQSLEIFSKLYHHLVADFFHYCLCSFSAIQKGNKSWLSFINGKF